MDVISYSKAKKAQLKADSVQAQLDQAILAGDQLVEVQQARVDADGTTTYTTLKERLDTEYTGVAGDVAVLKTNMSEQNSDTATLGHGLSVINSDMPSPLKVEFHGESRINKYGVIGGFNNESVLDSFTPINVTQSLDTTKKVSGNSSLKLTTIESGTMYTKHTFSIEPNKLYLITVKSQSDGVVKNDVRLSLADDTTFLKVGALNIDYWDYKIFKFSSGENTEAIIYLYAKDGIGSVWYDELMLTPLTQTQYDQIGVSLTDADVERMFPYCDSVQHAANPVVKVSNKNLFDGKMELGGLDWVTGGNTSTPSSIRSANYMRVLENEDYVISAESGTKNYDIIFYDEKKKRISATNQTGDEVVITPPVNAYFMRFLHASTTDITIKHQVELGDVATPYVPYNPSYLYAQTTLAGNSLKKDILSYNKGASRWEKIKNWETDVVLDGSLDWSFFTDYSGFKRLTIPLSGGIDSSGMVVKYDGKIIPNGNVSSYPDLNYVQPEFSRFNVSISDTDTGWTETQSITGNMIKGLMNGWQYSGDGTTHTWVAITDGITVPASQTEAFVADPVNKPSGWTGWATLTYQLAEPVTEVVDVEGDLSISGDAQVEVLSGFTYTTDPDTGVRTYTVTPEAERYDVTCNLTEVKMNYQTSLKSSFQRTVEKQSDIATGLSVNTNAIVDLYARVKSLESGV